jgi:hypothetical protein
MDTAIPSISFEVDGLPPAKSQARSMLGARHPHTRRVAALLTRARDALVEQRGGQGFGPAPRAIEVVLTTSQSPPGDASNYLGGIADVLESKAHRGRAVDHLGALSDVALYDNDRQLHELHFHLRPGARDGYTVRLCLLRRSSEASDA